MNGELQHIRRHAIVPPVETIHQLNFNHADTLDNPTVGFLTQNRPTVAEIPQSWNSDEILWNIIEFVAALCIAAVMGMTVYAFAMMVMP